MIHITLSASQLTSISMTPTFPSRVIGISITTTVMKTFAKKSKGRRKTSKNYGLIRSRMSNLFLLIMKDFRLAKFPSKKKFSMLHVVPLKILINF